MIINNNQKNNFYDDVVIYGGLSALSGTTFTNTVFTTTSALSVINNGAGPALYVSQAPGNYDIASFYDQDGVEVLHVGNAFGGLSGRVGINESYPGVELTVNGQISANNVITALNGSSISWNSVYTEVNSSSANYARTNQYTVFNNDLTVNQTLSTTNLSAISILLGIGNPNASLTVARSAVLNAPPGDTLIHLTNSGGNLTRIALDNYDNSGIGTNYSSVVGRGARGSSASPTASQVGDILLQIGGRGYGSSAFSSSGRARINLIASENWTNSKQGTNVTFEVAASGTSTAQEVGRFTEFGITAKNLIACSYSVKMDYLSAVNSYVDIFTVPAGYNFVPDMHYATIDAIAGTASSVTTSRRIRLARNASNFAATGNLLLNSLDFGTVLTYSQYDYVKFTTDTGGGSNKMNMARAGDTVNCYINRVHAATSYYTTFSGTVVVNGFLIPV